MLFWSNRYWTAYWNSSFSCGGSPRKSMRALPLVRQWSMKSSTSGQPSWRQRFWCERQNSCLECSVHNVQNGNRHWTSIFVGNGRPVGGPGRWVRVAGAGVVTAVS